MHWVVPVLRLGGRELSQRKFRKMKKKNRLLMTVAAVALIAGTSGALAQQEPSRAAPAEKTAPKAPAGEIHQNTAPSGGAMKKGEADSNRENAEQRGDRNKSNGRSETTGQAPQEGRDGNGKQQRATDQKKPDAKANEEKASRDNERNHATTGQAAAPTKGANVTPESRSRIHDAFANERSSPRVDHVDFGLSVGTAVPRSVRIVAVPETIIEIQPTWRGYEYFKVGDQIVIVDPRSMEIVAVLDV
jgi:hypothetical protein